MVVEQTETPKEVTRFFDIKEYAKAKGCINPTVFDLLQFLVKLDSYIIIATPEVTVRTPIDNLRFNYRDNKVELMYWEQEYFTIATRSKKAKGSPLVIETYEEDGRTTPTYAVSIPYNRVYKTLLLIDKKEVHYPVWTFETSLGITSFSVEELLQLTEDNLKEIPTYLSFCHAITRLKNRPFIEGSDREKSDLKKWAYAILRKNNKEMYKENTYEHKNYTDIHIKPTKLLEEQYTSDNYYQADLLLLECLLWGLSTFKGYTLMEYLVNKGLLGDVSCWTFTKSFIKYKHKGLVLIIKRYWFDSEKRSNANTVLRRKRTYERYKAD